MKIKAIFFDIDDTLYDSTLQTDMARRNTIRAMIEAGLEIEEDEGIKALNEIVEKFGSNYGYHLNELLREFGYEENPRIIAAGIVAYHSTKIAYLVPFPDTIPTLLKLRDLGYGLGVITDGIAVKQWEKLIRLGLQHFFDSVIISEEIGIEKPNPEMFKIAARKIKCKPEEAIMVGDRIDKDIVGANKVGMLTVQLMHGKHMDEIPKNPDEEPDYIISNLRDILKVLKEIKKRN
ncbi:MAG: haloacid dehalogenase [Candidatus Altiarchaeales archaeon]|nr:MAG: haloacid dehalogenase [Candidatus Altiarchaeales archaeon]RLI94057.1 MAG: haloacid dehalogenase [Candidatus Altiarchaeales archaeon]HDO82842.1 TIGR02253 family HAD-type hydrolase [Candidatus Altiarchaeales archaeon]HEX55491.1 TIGR02253 family HAD-type hydrolase [Candidatus Altiarchaeales archaeon]